MSIELDRVAEDPEVKRLRELHEGLIHEERRKHNQAMAVKTKLIAREREIFDALC